MITAFEHFRPHHEELRKRLTRSFLVIAICTVVAYLFIDPIAGLFTRPLFLADPTLKTLVYTKLTEAFISYIKLALLVGILVSSPYLLYQIWMFISRDCWTMKNALPAESYSGQQDCSLPVHCFHFL